MSPVDTELQPLYSLVTEQITRAELLADLGSPRAREAYADLSLTEERIAARTKPTGAQGQIARRGAIRAALTAGDDKRAWRLWETYASEPGTDPGVLTDLRALFWTSTQVKQAGPLTPAWKDSDLSVLLPSIGTPTLLVNAERSALAAESIAAALDPAYNHLLRAWTVQVETQSLSESLVSTFENYLLRVDGLILIGDQAELERVLSSVNRPPFLPILALIKGSIPTQDLGRQHSILDVESIDTDRALRERVFNWSSRNRLSIERGPVWRREVQLRFLPLQSAFGNAFINLALEHNGDNALEEVAKAASMSTSTLLRCLDDPLELASKSTQELSNIASALRVSLGDAPQARTMQRIHPSEDVALWDAAVNNRWNRSQVDLVRLFAQWLGSDWPLAERRKLDRSTWEALFERLIGRRPG